MKHLPDLLTLRHRCPLFRSSVRLSVGLSTFMSKFDIYVRASILINYKTKQPSNLAWNISLTSWLCEIGVRYSIRLTVRPSICWSICQQFCYVEVWHVKVGILINYNQSSNLACNISLTSWLCDIGIRFSVRPSVCLSVCPSVNICVKVRHLCQS